MAVSNTKSSKSKSNVDVKPTATPVAVPEVKPVETTPVPTLPVDSHTEPPVETTQEEQTKSALLEAFDNLNSVLENTQFSKISAMEYVDVLNRMQMYESLMTKLHKHCLAKLRTSVHKKHNRQNKQPNPNRSPVGISRVAPVPPTIKKFLGLPDNKEYARTDITKLCNQKFKDLNLIEFRKNADGKEHKFVKLTPEVMQTFMLSKTDEFKASDFQSVLKKPYESLKAAQVS